MLAGAREDASALLMNVRPRAWSVIANAADCARIPLTARLLRTRIEVRAHVDGRRRWALGVPEDVAVDGVTLALWFAARGVVAKGGYGIRLSARGLDAERLRHALTRHGWQPSLYEDRGPNIRITRPGDRVAFHRLVASYIALPDLRNSGDRVRPRPLEKTTVEEIRRRLANDEPYADIARDFAINPRTVGKIARGETHVEPSVSIIRRRAPVKRLSRTEEERVLALAEDGLSQHAIAHLLGTNQPRISRLLSRHRQRAA